MDYLNKPFVVGTVIIITSSWLLLPDFFTFRSSLKAIKGKIESTRNTLDIVTHKDRYGFEDKRLLNTLSFKLKKHHQLFSIKKNFGSQLFTNSNETYQGLGEYLDKSDSVTIWIREDETSVYEPKIFEMEVNGKKEIFFDEVRFAFMIPYFISLIFGLALMYLGVHFAEKEKLKKND